MSKDQVFNTVDVELYAIYAIDQRERRRREGGKLWGERIGIKER